MSGQYLGGRIFGLDVMRATAGIMVTLSHTSFLVAEHWPRYPLTPSLDWVGVFFVLSGFLIGGILLDASAKPGPAPLHFLNFMQRRWLRTLPNYYLFLVLNILLVFIGAAPGMLSNATPAYAVFMQNFHVPLDLFFWESWSLAVEEWFYLLFPLLVFGAIGLIGMGGRRAFVLACVLFITLPFLARISVAHHVVDQATWDIWVNKMVITRLDAPGFGMFAAWLSRGWPKGWQRMRWPAMLLGIGLLTIVTSNGYQASPHFAIYGLNSLEAFSVALLLPVLSTWQKGGVFGGPLRYLSLITYALYLVHLPMLYLFGDLVPNPVAWICAANYVLFLAVALLFSTLIYHFWERPFMRLRNPLGHWLSAHWPRSASDH